MPPRVISMLLVGQLLVIFLGVAITGSLLRVYEIQDPPSQHPDIIVRTFPFYVRDYGFWLCLLPLGWAIAAIRDARAVKEKNIADQRFELIGWVLLGALLVFFACAAFNAYGHSAADASFKHMRSG